MLAVGWIGRRGPGYPWTMTARASLRTVDIPRVIASAQAFNLWTPDAMDAPPDEVIHGLFAALDRCGARYLLVGGIALLRYVDGRNTEDIDLVIALDDARAVPGLVIESHDRDFARARFSGLRVDLLLARNPLFRHVLERHGSLALDDGQPIQVADAAGLVLLKLYALPSLYRQALHDKVRLYEADIAMLIQAQDVDTDAVLGILNNHVSSSDAAELRSIVAEIRERIERGGRFGEEEPPS